MPATAASGPAFPPPPGLAGQDTLADDLIAAVGDLKRSLRRRAGPPWPDLASLSGSQVELLRLIRRRPDLTVAAAAAELRLAANTVSTLVGQLTGVGLIRRTPDPEDRRIARLRLTPDADRALQLWGDRRTAAVAAALDGGGCGRPSRCCGSSLTSWTPASGPAGARWRRCRDRAAPRRGPSRRGRAPEHRRGCPPPRAGLRRSVPPVRRAPRRRRRVAADRGR